MWLTVGAVAVVIVAVVLVTRLGGSSGDDTNTTATPSSDEETTVTVATTHARYTTLEQFKPKMVTTFAEFQPQVAQALKSDSLVEAVVALEYHPDTNEVYVDIASKFTGGDSSKVFFDEHGWRTASELAGAFWPPDIVQYVDPNLLPALHIRLDSKYDYTCPNTFMLQVANRTAGQEQFDTNCIH